MYENMLVISTGIVGGLFAQVSTNVFENVTPLAIVAVVVYFFLVKFDRKMDSQDRKIDLILAKMKEREAILKRELAVTDEESDENEQE